MINHQVIKFSEKKSEERINHIAKFIGLKVIKRIIAFALFLLGGNRDQISEVLSIPKGTFLSLLNRFNRNGVDAFIDKRENKENPLKNTSSIEIQYGNNRKIIALQDDKCTIVINKENEIQLRTIMLTLMNNKLISSKDVSEMIGFSQRHVNHLNKNLNEHDVNSLIDQRKGQQKDYVVTEDVKAEIIAQYTTNLICNKSTSSNIITEQVNKACKTSVSERTIREQISKLGLDKIRKTLPKILEDIKKNSKK